MYEILLVIYELYCLVKSRPSVNIIKQCEWQCVIKQLNDFIQITILFQRNLQNVLIKTNFLHKNSTPSHLAD